MDQPITLAIAGDVMLGRLVNQTIARKGFAYPWGDVVPILREADAVLINLECALTAETERWHDGDYKAFYFRADPPVVATLAGARVAFASLANNHVCDFGAAGMEETLAVLDRAGIAHAGAGRELAAAQTPAVLDVRGTRVGIVAFADHPPAWTATATTPGINYTPVSLDPEDFAAVEAALAAARRVSDFVVFTIHWGPNMRARPTPAFRDFARRVMTLRDAQEQAAGADLFWGHSAHVVQGMEVHEGRLILYDTGDFVDDYAVDRDLRNDLSALFLVRVRPPIVERVELVPVRIDEMQVNVAKGADRRWLVRRLTSLCREMDTTLVDDGERLAVQLRPERQPERAAT